MQSNLTYQITRACDDSMRNPLSWVHDYKEVMEKKMFGKGGVIFYEKLYAAAQVRWHIKTSEFDHCLSQSESQIVSTLWEQVRAAAIVDRENRIAAELSAAIGPESPVLKVVKNEKRNGLK